MSELATAAALAADYALVLEVLICRQVTAEQAAIVGPTAHATLTAAPEPWYAAAGGAAMDIHDGARAWEDRLRERAGLPVRHRGGTLANTLAALGALPDLLAAGPAETHAATGRCRCTAHRLSGDLARWVTAAQVLPEVGQAPRWRRIRLVERHTGRVHVAVCPGSCGFPSLRYDAGSGQVRCFTEGCVDRRFPGTGERAWARPVGLLRVHAVTADAVLAWADGLTWYGDQAATA